MLFNV